MRVISVVPISDHPVPESIVDVESALADVLDSVRAVVWPAGSDRFVLNPTPEANGTPAIKTGFIDGLLARGWKTEVRIFPATPGVRGGPGAVDAATALPEYRTVVEWETGNVSSSHRALNKMLLALMYGLAAQGIWVVPSKRLYKLITGRTGHFDEVAPYFPVLNRPDIPGRLLAVVIEHDGVDPGVAIIGKMVYRGNVPSVAGSDSESDLK